MICTMCHDRPATSRGLCSACYQRERKAGRLAAHAKRQRLTCSVDGCTELAASKGWCKRHAEQVRRGTLHGGRAVADLPGERWAEVAGHPGWWVSTEGRIKSTRRGHERVLSPRLVDGRLLVGDKQHGNLFVHLAVLRAFCPGIDGDAIFVDGDAGNCRLANLRWDTREEKIKRAIAMAKVSNSPWGPAFADYWGGNTHALDQFFIEMKEKTTKALLWKMITWQRGYHLNVEEVAHITLVRLFFSIHAATITSLDGITNYTLTVADRVLYEHWGYSKPLVPIEIIKDDGQSVSVLDAAGWCHPSAELVAEYRMMT